MTMMLVIQYDTLDVPRFKNSIVDVTFVIIFYLSLQTILRVAQRFCDECKTNKYILEKVVIRIANC
jgi:hypothetical protein